ncbi:MAG TPA: 4-(cytidine 5'-diphospho)-2-C-methyl-D-erythritol kinase [Bacillota bacterium]|nr:4-(cytidine 5'-diphospho)-2-C-methyl-D-erythritol kinase [Bacillota bacterium]
MLRLFSPAKVNLYLKVHHRRPDGYHELTTVLQTVDFGDFVSLAPADRLRLSAPPYLPQGADNLAWRAAEAFYGALRRIPRVQITLEKHIPVQAGLGGGSSNAATVLRGLNAMHGFPLNVPTLGELAAGLGSDVAFFLHGGTALATGRGEKVHPLPDLLPFYVRIIKPPFGLSTAEVYALWSGTGAPLAHDSVLAMLRDFDPKSLLQNDLEQPAFALRPELMRLKDRLVTEGAEAALLSGSGSAVFGVYRHKPIRRPSQVNGSTEWLVRTLPAYDIIE